MVSVGWRNYRMQVLHRRLGGPKDRAQRVFDNEEGDIYPSDGVGGNGFAGN